MPNNMAQKSFTPLKNTSYEMAFLIHVTEVSQKYKW